MESMVEVEVALPEGRGRWHWEKLPGAAPSPRTVRGYRPFRGSRLVDQGQLRLGPE